MTTLEKMVAACKHLGIANQGGSLGYIAEAVSGVILAVKAYEREPATYDPPSGVALPPMETAVEQIAAPAVDRDTLGLIAFQACTGAKLGWNELSLFSKQQWRDVADTVLAAAGRQAVDVEAIRAVASSLRGNHGGVTLNEHFHTLAARLESALAPAQTPSEGKRA